MLMEQFGSSFMILFLFLVKNLFSIYPKKIYGSYETVVQISPGVWYFGLFNGIGPTRTQSKMVYFIILRFFTLFLSLVSDIYHFMFYICFVLFYAFWEVCSYVDPISHQNNTRSKMHGIGR